jgi:phosphoribosylformimino-5-aminoimidazole carboxamide ribotide isomerase
MIIFPAVDIKEGKVVRLIQGKFDAVTEYAQDPVTVALKWEKEGAQWVHVVDLDGAKTGVIKNIAAIKDIAGKLRIPVQMGGGVRVEEDVESLIEGGVARVVLGTKAIQDRNFFKNMLKKFGKKIAVSLDCQNGFLTQRGWTETTNIKATDFVKELESAGLQCLIYTDIARDGMLTGPNIAALKEILSVTRIPVIASGGIAQISDVKELAALEAHGIVGAITGKALYEGKLDLKEAIQAAQGKV